MTLILHTDLYKLTPVMLLTELIETSSFITLKLYALRSQHMSPIATISYFPVNLSFFHLFMNRIVGAVVGTTENKENYVTDKVNTWIEEVKLSEIACTQPHAAYSAFIHGLRHRFTYTLRTIPDIAHLLKPLDKAIDNFIRVLFQGYLFNSDERTLLSLPARLGGWQL